MNPASNRKVLINPDVDATRERLIFEAAADDDEGLLVLGTDRIEQLLARG
jgi:hypothetical protein